MILCSPNIRAQTHQNEISTEYGRITKDKLSSTNILYFAHGPGGVSFESSASVSHNNVFPIYTFTCIEVTSPCLLGPRFYCMCIFYKYICSRHKVIIIMLFYSNIHSLSKSLFHSHVPQMLKISGMPSVKHTTIYLSVDATSNGLHLLEVTCPLYAHRIFTPF